jgi:hemerythrin
MEIKGKLNRGEMVMTVEVMTFLKDWLAGHIKGTDKKYGPFLSAKGVR